ncbi:division/cell wall cluster transcriptional repressor MraZ [Sphingomonas morindae]|uniref:Transcriptional regulator MraZ n=1 Tax=Sphingomonas morindae TaxID=1541170 RepID=A0ABY4XA67_9SPHN|nr:division/cell wall cluster transcriptional repressor MraZ [Sphingomonas morindae]USI73641.1 division/cell wall cluster transcriptional repressor MraZ [Sphingomonas morindae]
MELGHLFQGHALNAVDAKGRVSVPAGFRALIEKRALGAGLDPDNTLSIGEHASGDCLTALDPVASAEMDRQLQASVAELPAIEQMAALEAARLDSFGSLEPVKFDGAGRMVLTPMLRMLGQIEDLAFFIGAGSSFQIWNPLVALDRLPATSRARKPLQFLLRERGVAL